MSLKNSNSTEENKEDYAKLILDLQITIDLLQEKDKKLTEKQVQIMKEKRDIEENLLYKKTLLQTYSIQQNMDTMFDQDIKSIPHFYLLTETDLFNISNAIDKKDYTSIVNNDSKKYPRFIDLENVVSYVIQVKKAYPLWKLTKISLSGKIDTHPPKNYYTYYFTTPEGFEFIKE